jgi:hypothetical protein
MKLVPAIFLLLSILLLQGCRNLKTGTGSVEEVRIPFNVRCAACVEYLRESLAYVKGVKSMELDTERQELSIQYNPSKTKGDIICRSLSKAGFDAGEYDADPEKWLALPECCRTNDL